MSQYKLPNKFKYEDNINFNVNFGRKTACLLDLLGFKYQVSSAFCIKFYMIHCVFNVNINIYMSHLQK